MLSEEHLLERLLATARERGVEVMYACESGSRAWGLGSTDSDYDVRFVYRHPREWYLKLHRERDMIGPVMEHDGELDLVGWDVAKFMAHIANGNPNVFEWLASPTIYYAEDAFGDRCRTLADNCFRPRKAIAHYLGIARGARQAGLGEDGLWNLKKFCYWMRPILAATYVAHHRHRNPITMDELMPLVEEDPAREVVLLMEYKSTVSEDHRMRIDPGLVAYLEELEAAAHTTRDKITEPAPPKNIGDDLFRQTIGYP